ncbi:MAG: UDP-N-acetylmuramoyl-tripeptide--D-alanyl-D-alanine ligase [Thermoanaerobaculales bacterium]|jgi:UDP-N-acetylmuramoyl-tripeptide--D-alanyl-D-alanine ligase|nr:UDP-N-acetylmuramoyl-tripeptide--D-alanyl-D-alanine ligase [Thermoanaerobaculales bacterium]
MNRSASEVARIVSGFAEGAAGVVLNGAEVDSRNVEPGDLFVALRGSRSDGHAFVDDALEVAGAALVRYDAELDTLPAERALIRVEDPLKAYWTLALHERRERGWEVVAVTGSVGKTTTKEMLAAILASSRAVGSTSGNRNSTLGLPAEVLSQPEGIELFVAEMGMSRAGELDVMGVILEPGVLVYTTIAPVHSEFFPNIKAIVEAKAELLGHLDADGTLVINADDPHQAEFPARTPAAVLRYGSGNADARIEGLVDRGLFGTRFSLHLPSGSASVELPLAGRHQAENLLAAATAAHVFGVSADTVAAIASSLEPAPRRGRIHRLSSGATIVDDSYNASPLAVRRLLELLAAEPNRRIAVLGEMYELGEDGAEAHREIGREAAGAADLLVTVGGEDAAKIAEAARAAGLSDHAVHEATDAEDAAELLRNLLESKDVVLIKGSRGVRLDRTVDLLLEGGED